MSRVGRSTGLRAPRPCIETEKPTSSTGKMCPAFVRRPKHARVATRDAGGWTSGATLSPGKAMLQSWEVMAAILGALPGSNEC